MSLYLKPVDVVQWKYDEKIKCYSKSNECKTKLNERIVMRTNAPSAHTVLDYSRRLVSLVYSLFSAATATAVNNTLTAQIFQ